LVSIKVIGKEISKVVLNPLSYRSPRAVTGKPTTASGDMAADRPDRYPIGGSDKDGNLKLQASTDPRSLSLTNLIKR